MTSTRRAAPPSAPDLPAEALILGVDPGLTVTGWGLVRVDGTASRMLTYGALRPKGATPDKLTQIYGAIRDVIAEHSPTELAIEQQFVALNVRAALAVGEARAAAVLAAAHAGLSVHEYPPASVKQAVTGYGRGGKDQVGEMIKLQFGLRTVPEPADAADALAIALCHVAHRRTATLAARGR